jgi:hypothetical protein
MNEYVVHGSLALPRGSVLRIEDGSDLLLYVWEGSLWLTQERDARDRHLGAGDWFRLERDGVTLASASSRATLTLTAPQPEGYARRISLTRSGSRVELYSGTRQRGLWARLFAPYARPTTAAL